MNDIISPFGISDLVSVRQVQNLADEESGRIKEKVLGASADRAIISKGKGRQQSVRKLCIGAQQVITNKKERDEYQYMEQYRNRNA